MNTIVEKLIKDIKSKPPTEWKMDELEEFGFKIRTLYEYSDIVDRGTLRPIYDRIVKIINNDKAFIRVSPGALDYIDKH